MGIGNTLVVSKQISKMFFQISAQVYSVPDQIAGKRKAFLEWTSIDLSFRLSLTCGRNVHYYKSVHHPILALPVRIGKTLAIFETNFSVQLSVQVHFLFG